MVGRRGQTRSDSRLTQKPWGAGEAEGAWLAWEGGWATGGQVEEWDPWAGEAWAPWVAAAGEETAAGAGEGWGAAGEAAVAAGEESA